MRMVKQPCVRVHVGKKEGVLPTAGANFPAACVNHLGSISSQPAKLSDDSSPNDILEDHPHERPQDRAIPPSLSQIPDPHKL